MAEPKRKFTPEFKLEAVWLVACGDKPLAQVARGLRPCRSSRSPAGLPHHNYAVANCRPHVAFASDSLPRRTPNPDSLAVSLLCRN